MMDKVPIGIQRIRELLPHRYPMLMIDRVIELSADHVLAEKLISANEPFFAGHFPDQPVFPGVLIVEAMAQAGGIWAMNAMPENQGMKTVLVGVDEARFRRQVVPGDVLRMLVRPTRARPKMVRFSAVASVAGETVAEALLLAAFVKWDTEGEG
jgi:3-hydroxyacyl-[acyl-carrier-protein] dehydratase